MRNPFNTRLNALIALLLFAVSLPLSAQLLNETDLLLQPTEQLNQNTTRGGSDAYIQQIGSNNELQLMQQQEGIEGNLARVLQAGEWNLAIISQTQTGNKLALIQKGTNNYYELVNSGFENELVNIQNGQNNRIVQQLVNSNQITSELVQQGNNNEIIQILENVNAQSFSIRQVGDGLKVTITRIGN